MKVKERRGEEGTPTKWVGLKFFFFLPHFLLHNVATLAHADMEFAKSVIISVLDLVFRLDDEAKL